MYDEEILQTRCYSPQWRRFINADGTFIAGEDVINGSNMYAYSHLDMSRKQTIAETLAASFV